MSRDGEYLKSCIGWILKVANTWSKKPMGGLKFRFIELWKNEKRFIVVHIMVILFQDVVYF
jgi:hypothetical protein